MNVFERMDEGGADGGDDRPLDEPPSTSSSVHRLDEDYGEILRLLISEGTDASLEMFTEAKDPNIDFALKTKLRVLGSRIGDNVRKAIATHARYFGGQG